uniref:Protein kinase domain-containing protein n=1 Tax=Timema cristinae TaxID=61476 RepID=A0A7R9GY75_TIMCR|nr:unnamed protein product [Timema cristinae]
MNVANSEENALLSRGYKLLNKVGEGSYSTVYLVECLKDTTEGSKPRSLVCKVIDTKKASTSFVTKFLPREIDILVNVSHPHIVQVSAIFQRLGKYFIFMRHAEMGDLIDHLVKNGPVLEDRARVWHRQLTLALQYLHELGIAHRDIKCENILITINFNAKLGDFGFSRYTNGPKEKPILSSTYCGSVSYIAPEIIRGKPYAPLATDIWSLGVVLFVMLNNSIPFPDKRTKRMYKDQTTRNWRFRAKIEPALSEQVKEVVRNMLEPDVKRRWKVEQVLRSRWIAMEPSLLRLNSDEELALNSAREKNRKLELDALKSEEVNGKKSSTNQKKNVGKSPTTQHRRKIELTVVT